MSYDINIRVFKDTGFGGIEDVCQGDIRDGERAAVPNIIRSKGTLPVQGDAGTVRTWLTINANHPIIGGYKKIQTSLPRDFDPQTIATSMPEAGPFPEEVLIEEFASIAGQMDGEDSNTSTTEFWIVASKAATSSDAKVRVDVYHRTTGGTETPLGSFTTPILTTSLVKYTECITITQSWLTNELLVFKYTAIDEGVPI